MLNEVQTKRPIEVVICATAIWLLIIDVPELQPVQARVGAEVEMDAASNLNGEPTGVQSCHWREFDLCAVGTFSLFQNPNGLPQSDPELKRQCEFLNDSMKCFDNFAVKCFTGVQYGLFRFIKSSPEKLARDFCESKSELRQNYTKHVQCFRQIQRTHQRTCLTDFQVGFESIHKIDHKLRLQTACCNLNRMRECIFEPIEYECGIGAAETLKNLLESIFGGLMDFPCREYDPFGSNCTSLLPKIGTRPHGGRSISALSKIISGFTNVPSI